MKKQILQRALVGLCLAFSAAVQASSFSSLVFFGDSLSDSGNNAVILGNGGSVLSSDADYSKIPYASGRYSNGPVWSEQFAAKMGLSATASLLGGTNYAFGGAQTSVDGTDGPGGFPFSMKVQLNMFLDGFGANPAHTVSGNELFVVAGGGNNVRDTLANIQLVPTNAQQLLATAAAAYAQDIGSIVDTLQAPRCTAYFGDGHTELRFDTVGAEFRPGRQLLRLPCVVFDEHGAGRSLGG